MSVPNPLDRPVAVDQFGKFRVCALDRKPEPVRVAVLPSDVLAALDDDAREAAADRIMGTLARLCDGTTVEREREIARAVVAALCDREGDTDAPR